MTHLRSKYESTLEKLLEGRPISAIAPHSDPAKFWSEFFTLQVDSAWLFQRINGMTKEECMHEQKALIGALFDQSLRLFVNSDYQDSRKTNTLETLIVLLRSILQKDLAGWEVMDLLAGNVSESDRVFGLLAEIIETTLEDSNAPAHVKHKTLQLALVFACGIGQLSPGAYLLRRDLFPALVMLVKAQETTQFTFEAILLLSILANYHKSEAANLNPYLKRLRGTVDHTFLNKINWALEFAFDTAAKSYQNIQDDSPPTIVSSFGSFLTSLRPDRALASTPIETPRELFKDQPIEASVGLLALHELLQMNPVFSSVVIESLSVDTPSKRPPMVYSLLSLASYVFAHASSVGTQRSLAYAGLSMRIYLLIAQEEFMVSKLSREPGNVRICRQRLPKLPEPPASRPLLCSLLDGCVLWLRHNLHKKLEVSTFRLCVQTLHNLLWVLQRQRIRLEYHWEEVWRSLFALLEFLSSRLENVRVLGRVDELVKETLVLLETAALVCEKIMPTPESLVGFVYESIRSKSTIEKQADVLATLEIPDADKPTTTRAITTLKVLSDYYQEKISQRGDGLEIDDVMKIIGAEVERDGVRIEQPREPEAPLRRNSEMNFVKWACVDGLALLS